MTHEQAATGGSALGEDARQRLLNQALNAIAVAITAEADLDKVFQVIADAARMLVHARATIIYQVNDDLSGLVSAAFSYANASDHRDPGKDGFMIPLGRGLISDIFHGDKPVRIANINDHPRRKGFPEGHMGITRLLGVPLLDRTGRSIGLLMASDRLDGQEFSTGDETIFTLMARQSGIAIENARLVRELRLANENLEAQVAARTEELHQKNLDLERANRLKSEFLAKMSHELRTPLNSIIGFSDMLLKQLYGPLNAQQKDGMERVARNGKHLLALINDVLDISKIEASKMPVRIESVVPREVVLHALAAVDPLARKKGHVIIQDLDRAPDKVFSDGTKLRQIALNLLTNAINFTDAGEIRVSVDAQGDRWCFVVADTGIGIEPQDLDRIFDEFYQVDSSTTRRVGGTGLGLPICAKMVRLLGGDLRVESQPGEGSTFTVTLPVASEAVEAM